MHILFIEFKKVRDSIHCKSLINIQNPNILGDYNFLQKLVKLVDLNIMDTFIKIRVGEAETDPILVKSDLRQWNFMSLVLFNL